jgi:hypothetical protein
MADLHSGDDRECVIEKDARSQLGLWVIALATIPSTRLIAIAH